MNEPREPMPTNAFSADPKVRETQLRDLTAAGLLTKEAAEKIRKKLGWK